MASGIVRTGVVPGPVGRDQGIGLPGTPASALVRRRAMVALEHRLHRRPRRLDRILAREKRVVAFHGVAQEPCVGRLLSRALIPQAELALLADELPSVALHASGEG